MYKYDAPTGRITLNEELVAVVESDDIGEGERLCKLLNLGARLHPDWISINWHIDDVLLLEPELSVDEARTVLQQARKHHDACIGINWAVLQAYIDDLPVTGL